MKSSSRTRSSSSSSGAKARASLLARMVTWLDSYTELYTIDPVKIERALKDYEGTDIEQIWKSLRKDVDRINELPERSEKIEKFVKSSGLARTVSILLTFVTFAFLLIFLSFTNQIKAIAGPDILLAAPGIVIAVMYAALMFNTFATRRLNKAMRNFYDQHAGELRKQTSRIKEGAQLLIDKLQREIYAQNLNPDKFKFEAYNRDYKGIKVVGNHRQRLVCTVKPKSRGSSE